jgi:hypothetical protein
LCDVSPSLLAALRLDLGFKTVNLLVLLTGDAYKFFSPGNDSKCPSGSGRIYDGYASDFLTVRSDFGLMPSQLAI